MNAAELFQSILDGTYNPELPSERKGKTPYTQPTRQMDLVERRAKLLHDLLVDLEDLKDHGNEMTPPSTYSSPGYLFSPRPLRPEERRAPILDLQWELEEPEPEPSLQVFHLMTWFEVASVKDQRVITRKAPTQPPIGTGRPKPRVAISDNDASDKPSFRLRPLPPCPQPQTKVNHDRLPYVPYGVFGKPVFTLPPKESQQAVSSQAADTSHVIVQNNQSKSSLNHHTEPRLSFLPFFKGQECHAY